jgi:hypothetical protein
VSKKRNPNQSRYQRERRRARHEDEEERPRGRSSRSSSAAAVTPAQATLVPNPSEYILTYITEDELGRRPMTLSGLRALVRSLPFEPSMMVLAKLLCDLEPVMDDPYQQLLIARGFYSPQPALVEALEQRLAGHTTRTIFSSQPLMLLARVLIEHAFDEPQRALTDPERRRLEHAVLGAHSALETRLELFGAPTTEAKLAYEVQAATFFRRPLMLEEMARHRELVHLASADGRLVDSHDYVPVADWLGESGLSIEQQWALGFGLVARTQAVDDNVHFPFVPEAQLEEVLSVLELPLNASLRLISSSRDDYLDAFRAIGGGVRTFGWEQRPFKATPFLRLEDGSVLLLSSKWLLSWLGEGFHYRALTHAHNGWGAGPARNTRSSPAM